MADRKINGAFGFNGKVYRAGQEDALYAAAGDAGKDLTDARYSAVLTGDWEAAKGAQAAKGTGGGTDYASMKKDDLQKLADERGLEVEGTGADGNVVKDDLVKALSA